MEQSIKSLYPGDSDSIKDKELFSLHPFSVFNSSTSRNRQVYAIVAAARDGAIGKNGDMIWHLPEDLRHFKKETLGHPVIMGRRTFESLPKGALPGRRNIVVTRNPEFSAPSVETAGSIENAIALCDSDEIPFIIGGEQIYRQSFPLLTRIYLTRIDADCEDADTFFPEIDLTEWKIIEESDIAGKDVKFRFITLERLH